MTAKIVFYFCISKKNQNFFLQHLCFFQLSGFTFRNPNLPSERSQYFVTFLKGERSQYFVYQYDTLERPIFAIPFSKTPRQNSPFNAYHR